MPTANPIIDNSLAFYGGELSLDVKYSDDGGYPEQGTLIQWYRDGSRQGELDGYEKVSDTYLDTGDYWYAMVRPRNDQGTWGDWTMSDIVWIINTPVWAYSCPGVYTVKTPFGLRGPAPISLSSSSFSSSSLSSWSSSSWSSPSSFSSSSFSSSSWSSPSSFSSSSSASSEGPLGCEFLYVGLIDAGTSVIDVSDPTNPSQVGYYDWQHDGWYGMRGVLTRETNIGEGQDINFSLEGSYGIRVLDVTDKTNPTQVGYLDCNSGMNADAPGMDIDEENNLLYVAVISWGVPNDDGLIVVDINDPTSPIQLGFLYPVIGSPSDVQIINSQYVALGNEFPRLDIVDVSVPATPTAAGNCVISGASQRIAYYNGYIYCAAVNGGLSVVDVSTPAAPVEVWSSYTEHGILGYFHDIHIANGYVYTSHSTVAGNGGIYIWDISNPALPTIAGTQDWGSTSFYNIHVSGSYAYIGDSAGIRILNISNPVSITQEGALVLTCPWDVFYRRTNLGTCFSFSSSSSSSFAEE